MRNQYLIHPFRPRPRQLDRATIVFTAVKAHVDALKMRAKSAGHVEAALSPSTFVPLVHPPLGPHSPTVTLASPAREQPSSEYRPNDTWVHPRPTQWDYPRHSSCLPHPSSLLPGHLPVQFVQPTVPNDAGPSRAASVSSSLPHKTTITWTGHSSTPQPTYPVSNIPHHAQIPTIDLPVQGYASFPSYLSRMPYGSYQPRPPDVLDTFPPQTVLSIDSPNHRGNPMHLPSEATHSVPVQSIRERYSASRPADNPPWPFLETNPP